MKKQLYLLIAAVALLLTACGKYKYESVAGDPLKTRIYTLDNGLKVYMSVNREQPRIQTYIAVRVGAKNDPIETTGLAHYFEHLMFKGTERFGTQDYAAEKPLLDEIEQLFEVYRRTTDPEERKAIYARIDSVSQEASKLAIPNEYDKLMAAIGSDGSNAWTSNDQTVYTEDIPSNQVENWAKIQSDRFAHNVIRGFHTELETVYEEYNMSLTSDNEKVFDTISALLYPNHPYGQHSVLGFQEHLKNPSITNIKNYYKTYYVPNNMAVCLSGDFDPDEMISLIDKYFGTLEPNPELPQFTAPAEEPITAPKTAEVYGLEAAMIWMAWPTAGGAGSEDAEIAQLVGSILSNDKCGLLDVDLTQQQKVLYSGAFDEMMTDRGAIFLLGRPKEGQPLEEVRDLLLAEVEKLRNGEFDEELLQSTIANYKRRQMQIMDSNRGRAMAFVDSFTNGTDWADEVTALDRLEKITKEQVVAWAQKNLGAENYVAVYKREGEDKNQKKIEKPHITPIAANRDVASGFLTEIQQSEVKPIAPQFLDFEKDMSIARTGSDIEVLYKRNETNDLFRLIYCWDFGTENDPALSVMSEYLTYLGTDAHSQEELARAFYDLACDFRVITTLERTYVLISGLGENMQAAMRLAEEALQRSVGDDEILAELKRDLIKGRNDAKLDQSANFRALYNYVRFGSEWVKACTLSDEQLLALDSDDLLAKLRGLNDIEHRILYYGPLSEKQLIAELDENHRVGENLKVVEKAHYPMQPTPSDRVVLAQYDAKQIYYIQCTNLGIPFSTDNDALVALYNAYFGGGMNAIVFQEMREARALAYSAWAELREGTTGKDPYSYSAFIATQNDKMRSAVEAFDEIIENMPRSEAAFNLAKQQLMGNLESQRTTKEDILWAYINAREKGVDCDRDRQLYETLKSLTLDDVVALQQEWVKNRPYNYVILGDRNDIDMEYLKTLGPVEIVSQETIFGY
ncbi:M16 family metallopeptidase [uncultured Alistipes sp.]|uniref:M16 family metallopeptidase n=1 Tax=uncultured Alistipes sp. TaxID=538949 RepID=UPI00261D358E|nr:M16 family metallopeptidase [uncultured Alistipes sp.]